MARPTDFCTKCGAALDVGARFCTECGAPMVSEKIAPVLRPAASSSRPKAPPRSVSPPLRQAIHPPRVHSEPTQRLDAPQRRPQSAPPPPVQPRPAPATATMHPVATPTTGGKAGSLVINTIVLALAWGLVWGLSESIAVVVAGGGFFLPSFMANAVGGLVAGGLAGAVLSVLYSGVSAVGTGRLVFLAGFWIGAEILTVAAWNALGFSTTEDYFVLTLLYGSVFGFLFAISMQARKPGWALLKVPFASSLLAFCAVAGRAIQFALFYG